MLYGTTFATAKTYGLSFAQALEKLSDARIVKVSITQSLVMDYTVPATPGSNVARCGVVIFESIIPGDRFLMQLPSIRTDKLELPPSPWNGININQADEEVSNVLALILTGDGNVAPVSAALNDLATVDAAYWEWRNP